MLKLRWPDACVVCGCALPAGAEAWWDATARTVTCVACSDKAIAAAMVPPAPELDRGEPAASVAREYKAVTIHQDRSVLAELAKTCLKFPALLSVRFACVTGVRFYLVNWSSL